MGGFLEHGWNLFWNSDNNTTTSQLQENNGKTEQNQSQRVLADLSKSLAFMKSFQFWIQEIQTKDQLEVFEPQDPMLHVAQVPLPVLFPVTPTWVVPP